MRNLPTYDSFLNENENPKVSMKIKTLGDDMYKVIATINNKEVGELTFIKSKFKNVLKGTGVTVDPSYRRMGIGSGMYEFAEKELGVKFVKSDDVLTPDGKALWNSKNRKFGI